MANTAQAPDADSMNAKREDLRSLSGGEYECLEERTCTFLKPKKEEL